MVGVAVNQKGGQGSFGHFPTITGQKQIRIWNFYSSQTVTRRFVKGTPPRRHLYKRFTRHSLSNTESPGCFYIDVCSYSAVKQYV